MIRSIILYGALGVSLILFWQQVLLSPCDRIISYDIGEFDTRFEMSQEEFITALERADSAWEDVTGNELFRYVPGASFKINLIFSEEQDRLHKGNDITKTLDEQEETIESNNIRYQTAISRHTRALDSYNEDRISYEKSVDYWNSLGGAPKVEFLKLKNTAISLEKKISEVNRLRTIVNKIVDENKIYVNRYNNGVSSYNSLFTDGKEFDAGNTDGKEINIYTYDGLAELHTLLVHEFGHVLGIEHTKNPASVMYYLLSDKNISGKILEEDILALEESCRL